MRTKMSRTVLVVTIGALALTLAACGGAANSTSNSKTLKIGVLQSFSGSFARFGEDAARGDELAVEAAGGKVAGRPVELVRGDATKAEQAISEVQRLMNREGVEVITGTYTSAASAAGSEVAARNNVVYWENHGLSKALTERNMKTFMRAGPSATTFAQASADFITKGLAQQLGKDIANIKVFIEHEDSVYGQSVARGQEALLKAAGAKVMVGSHAAAAADLTDAILRAKAQKPDVWLITGYVPDVNLLLRQAKGQNFHPSATILTGTGDSAETLEAVGKADLAGTFVVQYSAPLSNKDYASGWDKFVSAYRKKYKEEPLGSVSMTAYTGMTILLDALEKSGGKSDAESLRAAALSLDVPIGGMPNGWGIKFDETGQNTRTTLVTGQWRVDGTLPTVFPQSAAVGKVEGLGLSR